MPLQTRTKVTRGKPRGGKSKKINALKSAYTIVSLQVDKSSDTTQKDDLNNLF